MVLKDEKQHIYNVCMATYGQVKFAMGSSHFYCATHPLWKGRSGILPSTDLETMILNDVPAHCSRKLYISMNHVENVVQLLTHVQTVDTRCTSRFSSTWNKAN